MTKRDESGGTGKRNGGRGRIRLSQIAPRLRARRHRELVEIAAMCAALSEQVSATEILRLVDEALRPRLGYQRIAIAVNDGDHLVVRAATTAVGGESVAGRSGITIPLQRDGFVAGALLVSGTIDRHAVGLLEAVGAIITTTLFSAQRLQTLEANVAGLETQNEELEALSTADSLTGISNRRAFDATLVNEWRRATRSGSTISLLLVDIDHFKDFNDGLGHQAGDACLRLVATLLASSVRRAGDFVARIGGEEFGVILPDTPADAAERLANELCAAVRREAVNHPGSPIAPTLTVSVGIASTQPRLGSSPGQLYAEADAALYRAKGAGRDSVSR